MCSTALLSLFSDLNFWYSADFRIVLGNSGLKSEHRVAPFVRSLAHTPQDIVTLILFRKCLQVTLWLCHIPSPAAKFEARPLSLGEVASQVLNLTSIGTIQLDHLGRVSYHCHQHSWRRQLHHHGSALPMGQAAVAQPSRLVCPCLLIVLKAEKTPTSFFHLFFISLSHTNYYFYSPSISLFDSTIFYLNIFLLSDYFNQLKCSML